MKIATITLNPAIDQTVCVDNVRLNNVNRGQAIRFDASGKGVNVASYLAEYGVNTVVTGYLGQENVALFEQFFAAKGIEDRFVRIPGTTRINVKVVDEARQETTDINMPGLTPPQEAMKTLFDTIESLTGICDWFVLSGSLPPHTPATLYATLITQLKRHQKHILLDTSGDALREGIQAGPTIVKPNIEELEYLVAHSLTSEAEIQQAAYALLNDDVKLVVVSMGKEGAMLVEQATTLLVTPPAVQVKKTFGAGDAMAAGLVVARIQGLDATNCGRLATAFSMGAITQLTYTLPARDTLLQYFQQTSVRQYE
ncbi:MAG: 1-phosphofructokinase [Ktedonobacteraceae bacterium]